MTKITQITDQPSIIAPENGAEVEDLEVKMVFSEYKALDVAAPEPEKPTYPHNPDTGDLDPDMNVKPQPEEHGNAIVDPNMGVVPENSEEYHMSDATAIILECNRQAYFRTERDRGRNKLTAIHLYILLSLTALYFMAIPNHSHIDPGHPLAWVVTHNVISWFLWGASLFFTTRVILDKKPHTVSIHMNFGKNEDVGRTVAEKYRSAADMNDTNLRKLREYLRAAIALYVIMIVATIFIAY